jgi:hypothetical protein
MEDNNKLFVFEKNEVLLIFAFVILIAITAFTLGFRAGRTSAPKVEESLVEIPAKVNPAEIMELKSDVEEDADRISKLNKDRANTEDILGSESDDASLRLNDLDSKFKDIAKDDPKVEENDDDSNDILMPDMDTLKEETSVIKKEARQLSNKYTIQLIARQSRDLAAEYAEPFIAAGYDVIVNEVEIPSKGTWYRVSIGAFNTKMEAQEYMQSENDLFQGKDYIIKQFK